jgi:general secretion pathway protein I
VLLAHVCAENELGRLRLARQMPPVGQSDVTCEQAGQAFLVRLTVAPTPNPNFRRADAQVFANASPILRLSTILGRY